MNFTLFMDQGAVEYVRKLYRRFFSLWSYILEQSQIKDLMSCMCNLYLKNMTFWDIQVLSAIRKPTIEKLGNKN